MSGGQSARYLKSNGSLHKPEQLNRNVLGSEFELNGAFQRGSAFEARISNVRRDGVTDGFSQWKSECVTYEAYRREVALNAAESSTIKTNAARYFAVKAFRKFN
jgi:hypothetical protein